MGARKKISAEKRKEALKTMYFAKLQNVPTSPRNSWYGSEQSTWCTEVFF